jgi:hypothetical protein
VYRRCGAGVQEEVKKETRNFAYRSTTEGLDAAQQELRQVLLICLCVRIALPCVHATFFLFITVFFHTHSRSVPELSGEA